MTDLRCKCVKTSLVDQLKIYLINDVLVTYLGSKFRYLYPIHTLSSGRKHLSYGSRSFNSRNFCLTIIIEVKT